MLICAFEGWSDAGDAASTAARHLVDRWDGELVADLDPEEFYDFTSTRPEVELDGLERRIVWPRNELYACRVPGLERDALVLIGVEPQLRWRTFTEQVLAVADAYDPSLFVSLGALLADVPHRRPNPVIGTSSDQELLDRHGLRRSRYEGPTGILGVLLDGVRRREVATVSLWATVPAYVPGAPSPKAALGLVERLSELLGFGLETTDLEVAAAAWERQVSELVDSDEEMTSYVERLEEHYDDDEDEPELPSSETLIREVERFLREQGR